MKQTFLFTFVLFITFSGFAQINNSPYNDFNTTIGVSAGMNHTSYRFTDSLGNNSVAKTIQSFNGGVLIEHEISKDFVISPRLDLFVTSGDLASDRKFFISPFFLEFKLYLQYKRQESLNPLYFYAGPNYRKSLLLEGTSFTNDHDIALDFGLGLNVSDNSMAIELRYSLGLTNITTTDNYNSGSLHSFGLIIVLKEDDLL